jgi:hypothetical protein
MKAVAEQPEKVLEVERFDAGDLQVEQSVLPRIHIDGMHAVRPAQGVIECVAAGRRDDQDVVARPDFQGHAIQPRVFPAGVIDQVVAVDEFEDPPADPIEHRHAEPRLR